MKKTHSSLSDLQSLLNLIDDYIRSGYRRDHETRAEDLRIENSGIGNPTDHSHLPKGIEDELAGIADEVALCKKCELWRGRRKSVPGTGSSNPLVVVVGEGPGRDEDDSGLPFVGRAGQYLDRWLGAVKIGRDHIPLSRQTNTFITNIVKCRPPNNRDPEPDESTACLLYLERQIEILKPTAILSAGRISSQILTGMSSGIGALRGHVYRYKGISLVPTYHPSAVLRNPELRASVWEDLKLLKSLLESSSSNASQQRDTASQQRDTASQQRDTGST